VMWFAGSVVMGMLYDQSLIALVVFGVTMQLAAGAIFFGLRKTLATAASQVG